MDACCLAMLPVHRSPSGTPGISKTPTLLTQYALSSTVCCYFHLLYINACWEQNRTSKRLPVLSLLTADLGQGEEKLHRSIVPGNDFPSAELSRRGERCGLTSSPNPLCEARPAASHGRMLKLARSRLNTHAASLSLLLLCHARQHGLLRHESIISAGSAAVVYVPHWMTAKQSLILGLILRAQGRFGQANVTSHGAYVTSSARSCTYEPKSPKW